MPETTSLVLALRNEIAAHLATIKSHEGAIDALKGVINRQDNHIEDLRTELGGHRARGDLQGPLRAQIEQLQRWSAEGAQELQTCHLIIQTHEEDKETHAKAVLKQCVVLNETITQLRGQLDRSEARNDKLKYSLSLHERTNVSGADGGSSVHRLKEILAETMGTKPPSLLSRLTTTTEARGGTPPPSTPITCFGRITPDATPSPTGRAQADGDEGRPGQKRVRANERPSPSKEAKHRASDIASTTREQVARRLKQLEADQGRSADGASVSPWRGPPGLERPELMACTSLHQNAGQHAQGQAHARPGSDDHARAPLVPGGAATHEEGDRGRGSMDCDGDGLSVRPHLLWPWSSGDAHALDLGPQITTPVSGLDSPGSSSGRRSYPDEYMGEERDILFTDEQWTERCRELEFYQEGKDGKE